MRTFVPAVAAAAMATLYMSGVAMAADAKVTVGCTATTDCASAAIAVEDGIFKKNGLDVQLILIGLNSNIPAALLSNSIQIGGPTPSVFLQAVDGGLDLVVVSGASATADSTAEAAGVVVAKGSSIKTAKDFIGKKVGAPGIGAFLQVLFVKWLMDNGVDPKQVNFVEVTFPTMNDVLKSGAVDAVVSADPIMSRIISGGTGTVAAYFLKSLPEKRPQILYAGSRDWADANPDTIAAFRKSIAEASTVVNDQPDKAKAAISRFTKISLDVLSSMKVSVADPNLTPEELGWWVDVMDRQSMLQSKPDVAKLIQK